MGRLPRFPSGGTNRIRFKGYNLSRMAPPSKMLINALPTTGSKITANIQNFAHETPLSCTNLRPRPKNAAQKSPKQTNKAPEKPRSLKQMYLIEALFANHNIQNHSVCSLHTLSTNTTQIADGLLNTILNDTIIRRNADVIQCKDSSLN